MTRWFVAVLISKCYRARCLRRASKLLRPSPRLLPRNSSHLEAPEVPGAASWRLQRLWVQPLRGPKGSGSSYLEAPEALGAAISRLQRLWELLSRRSRGSGSSHLEAAVAPGAAISRIQRLSRSKWLRPQFVHFSRIFSSLEISWGALPTAPGASGGFEGAEDGFPVASSGLKSAPKWPWDE